MGEEATGDSSPAASAVAGRSGAAAGVTSIRVTVPGASERTASTICDAVGAKEGVSEEGKSMAPGDRRFETTSPSDMRIDSVVRGSSKGAQGRGLVWSFHLFHALADEVHGGKTASTADTVDEDKT